MTTDTSEKGLERLICMALEGPCDPPQGGMVRERPSSYGAGWIPTMKDALEQETAAPVCCVSQKL